MPNTLIASLLVITLAAAGGCTGAPLFQRESPPAAAHPADVVQTMLARHLGQLDANIGRLSKQISELEKMPDTPDPTIREIRALDLAGWQLHQQQWLLQREHFRFAQDQLRRLKENPSEKPKLLGEWSKHEREYEAVLDGFRQQRHALEKKRLQVEAQVVERYLR